LDTDFEEIQPRRCACGEWIPYRKAKCCAACSRRSSAAFYERHQNNVLARYHARKSLRTSVERKIRSARAYLAVYLKRGLVEKEPCASCRSVDVSPIQPDLDHPLVVIWACRTHKPRLTAELEADVRSAPIPPAQPRRDRRLQAQRPTWASTYDEVEAALTNIPPEEARQLRAAAGTVNGLQISTSSPLYRMNLVNAYKRRFPKNPDAAG
jgi:hypothetical protein